MTPTSFLNIGNRVQMFRSAPISFHFIICVLIILTGAVIAFPVSYLSSTNVVIGLALIPVSFFCSSTKRFNVVYFIATLLFCMIAYRYQVKIFYFFSVTFYLLVLIELFVGKCDQVILYLFLFMSPFCHQVIAIMGFPFRLGLSSLAGNILSIAGLDVAVDGNIMILNGSAFSVDEACMGLNMLSTSMLMAVFALTFRYRIQDKRLSFIKLLLFFLFVFIFNIVCNLLRIILLVAMKIGPENPMHQIVGIVCFVVYIMLPVFLLSARIVKIFGREKTDTRPSNNINIFWKSGLLVVSLAIMAIGVYINNNRGRHVQAEYVPSAIPGYTSALLNEGITKLHSSDVLVYIKPIPEFFSGEHTPLICWRGGGYSFNGIRKSIVNGHEVYIGRLVNAGGKLFTAWWYSNGKTITIDQIDWRYRMVKGEEKFRLINVTVEDEDTLTKNIAFLLGQKI